MIYNYIILLDYSQSEIVKIQLTQQEKEAAEAYEDFEEFLCTLEDKYNFRLEDCHWMVCDTLQERTILND